MAQRLSGSKQIRYPRHFFDTALPPELVQASAMFPFVPDYLRQPFIYEQLVARLPAYARITALTEAYFSNLAWFTGPIIRAQVMDELIPLFYPNRRPLARSAFHEGQLHELALLFALLANGSVADLTQDVINPEAEELEKLARVALGLRSIFTNGSLAACQTLLLLGSYETFTRRKTTSESAGRLQTFGMCIASSVSVAIFTFVTPLIFFFSLAFVSTHVYKVISVCENYLAERDPSHFKLDAETVDRRRRIFWHLNMVSKD